MLVTMIGDSFIYQAVEILACSLVDWAIPSDGREPSQVESKARALKLEPA